MTIPNMTTRTTAVDTLNDLIQTCRDGRDGYKRAAENVESSTYETLFREYANQRVQFLTKLSNLINELGQEPDTDSGIMATIHRGWMDFRAAISNDGVQAILEECERGEDAAKDAYEDALEKALPENIRSVVQDQYQQILAAHDRIRDLRDMKQSS